MSLHRRDFLKFSAAALAMSVMPGIAAGSGKASGRVVVVGGGFAG
jgi:uncharacterized protein (DUF1501 family)